MIITNAIITAYCACALCCGKANQPTACGKMPAQGVTVAARRSLPFGTQVEIAGHTYTVQDRLARKYDGRFDIYFADHNEAKKFGIQKQNVTIKERKNRP